MKKVVLVARGTEGARRSGMSETSRYLGNFDLKTNLSNYVPCYFVF